MEEFDRSVSAQRSRCRTGIGIISQQGQHCSLSDTSLILCSWLWVNYRLAISDKELNQDHALLDDDTTACMSQSHFIPKARNYSTTKTLLTSIFF
jgi:hypothetical protein